MIHNHINTRAIKNRYNKIVMVNFKNILLLYLIICNSTY